MSLESIFELLHELGISLDMGNQVQLHDGVGWNIWGLVFKSSVHVNGLVVIGPNGVSESLDGIELLPFGILSLIDLHKNIFSDSISSSSKNNHESSNENG